ncbi:MAG: response regulator [Dokdonella sp.]|uniref:response regulator n=1 Tax=Dokdonella sp. TaxID=2291710 RepID=UPI0025C48DCE|nr:response regulator [Dokdonella sp.]MBX3701480.1 response regulator [Dokdonella sp.]
MAEVSLTQHISSDEPRVLVVDGSRVVRRLIERVLKAELPHAVVVGCDTGEEALAHLRDGVIDLVTTALRLSDMDGMRLAHAIRDSNSQAYIPIVVVSGDVQERLLSRQLDGAVTDYFDKAQGFDALAAFIRGYVRPVENVDGNVLYVEDSRVVALATRRMMEKCGFTVAHVVSVEAALELLETARGEGRAPGYDLVLTDVSLKGELSGGDLLERIRGHFGYTKGALPVLIMTGDDNPANQSALLRAGANDLVHKPIEERLLVTKLQFQLRVARRVRGAAQA